MTRGIKVFWHDEQNNINEIEYFFGIDVGGLDSIPSFSAIPTHWPQWEEEPMVEYNVDTRCERPADGEVHLIVNYDGANNTHLVEGYPDDDFYWGKNTIVLIAGKREGECRWLRSGETQPERIPWEAFDLEGNRGRRLAAYLGSRRQKRFRNQILACDDHRCVLTRERTKQALEAAHLVPARNGENDLPFNGITLRADLHRLFDNGLFTFGERGDVVITAAKSGLSAAYRELLSNKRLPRRTFERVRETLSLESFRNR